MGNNLSNNRSYNKFIEVNSGANVEASSIQYRIRQSGGAFGNWQDSNVFTGLSPNITYIIEVYMVSKQSGEGGSASLRETTYDIVRITSAPDINFGDTARITKSNPGGATNRLRIEYINTGETLVVRENIGDDYTITFNDAEWDEFYKRLGTNNLLAIRYGRDTFGDTPYYHWIDKTLTLTGNQKTSHIGINGAKKRAKIFFGVNGSVKRAVMWIGNNGRKRCI